MTIYRRYVVYIDIHDTCIQVRILVISHITLLFNYAFNDFAYITCMFNYAFQ